MVRVNKITPTYCILVPTLLAYLLPYLLTSILPYLLTLLSYSFTFLSSNWFTSSFIHLLTYLFTYLFSCLLTNSRAGREWLPRQEGQPGTLFGWQGIVPSKVKKMGGIILKYSQSSQYYNGFTNGNYNDFNQSQFKIYVDTNTHLSSALLYLSPPPSDFIPFDLISSCLLTSSSLLLSLLYLYYITRRYSWHSA